MEKRRSEQLAVLHAGIAELYERRLSDKQIAEKLGCTPQTVFRWRKRNGKPLLCRLPAPNKKLDEIRARELYDRGLSDSEIGEIMGSPRSTVATWRIREFLPCNTTKQKKATRKLSPIAAVNAEARRRGMTYGQFAAVLYEEQKRAEELKNLREKRAES